jgi:cytochrome c peroxidase
MTRRILLIVLVPLLAAIALAAEPSIPADSLPKDLALDKIPVGLAPRSVPKDSPLTAARVALGRKLFFDPILSADNTVACANCHKPEHGFSEGKPRGIRGQELTRRAPSLFNRAYGAAFFWDGRAATLEEQALQPIANPQELGSSVEDAIKKLQAHDDYRKKFASAFDDGVTAANLGKALASFERVLLRGDAKVDRFRRGEHDIMDAAERHGMWLFESRGRCWRCHSGLNFSDESYHNTGVNWGKNDLGRFAVTKAEADRGKFKTPSLRGVALTAPYMHDGSMKTLDDVLEFYNRGGNRNPHVDAALEPLNLTKEELADLVAFLKTL